MVPHPSPVPEFLDQDTQAMVDFFGGSILSGLQELIENQNPNYAEHPSPNFL